MFAANWYPNQIEVIRTSDNSRLEPILTAGYPLGINISPDGNYLFVGQYNGNRADVSMLKLAEQSVVSSVAIPENPRSIVVTETGDRIIIADYTARRVYAFDVSGESLVQRFVTDLNTISGVSVIPYSVAFGSYPSPIPDIKINGADGPLILTAAETIRLSLHLDNNGHTEFADWWLLGFSPYGPLSWTPTTGWTYNRIPAYQGPLSYLRAFSSPVIPVGGLAPGTYRLIFGVDLVMDGFITLPYAYSDFIDVNIVQYMQ